MIEVKNVTKKYGNFVAVDDISFEVKDHEIVGFLGPNGAGKSTTMNMITGYTELTSGKIMINGFDISKSPKRAKKQIGYMPEDVPLYKELTVREYVTFMAELRGVAKKDRKEEVQRVLKETGLYDVQNKLIKQISRGYRQRTSLAGAIVGNPDVLILDEPTVGLDPKQIAEIRNLIKELGKNHTVILSSHILSEVSQICEKVVIINKGNILAIDTPENLENMTAKNNIIIVTVEDKEEKALKLKDKIEGLDKITKLKEKDDNVKVYELVSKKDIDIRKKVFEVFIQEDLNIVELKRIGNTLEDAFLNIIRDKEDTITKKKESARKAILEREEKLAKMTPEERKKFLKEEKKQAKLIEKEENKKERAKEKELREAYKNEKKLQKEKSKKFKKEEKDRKKERKEIAKKNKEASKEMEAKVQENLKLHEETQKKEEKEKTIKEKEVKETKEIKENKKVEETNKEEKKENKETKENKENKNNNTNNKTNNKNNKTNNNKNSKNNKKKKKGGKK